MDILFAPLWPFVAHPERIAVVAALWIAATVLLTFLRKKFVWLPAVAGIAWASFAAWERYCTAQGYNIRVDLFLIYPVLVVITVAGVVGLIGVRISGPVRFSLRTLMIVVTLVALALGMIVWLAS